MVKILRNLTFKINAPELDLKWQVQTHLEDQVSGRTRQEDSVTPSGASGVHVLLPLTAVFTVRITEETQAKVTVSK